MSAKRLLLTLLAVSVSAAAEDAVSVLHALDAGFVQVFEKIAPAVVVIEATKPDDDDDDDTSPPDFFFKEGEDPQKDVPLPRGPLKSEGSGFFIRADGFILTNLHVVDGAASLAVRLRDGRRFTAKLTGSDDRTDVAVLHIEGSDFPVPDLGDSDALRVGQIVCAIGAPFNQDYSFTTGVVSGKGRTNLLGATSAKLLYEDYIQTDAFINPGNSGGPLFDVDGRIVGMNTLINGVGRGLAFAIPSNMLRDISGQLIATGKVRRSWLGIRMVAIADSGPLRAQIGGIEKGVVVHTVEANSPAYRSELRPADVITAIDGMPLAIPHDLQKEILARPAGANVQLTVSRAGQTLKIPVTTGELPDGFSKLPASAPPVEPRREILGLTLEDTTPRRGARIAAIAPDSPAAKAGLAVGDIITAVQTERKTDTAEVVAALMGSLFAGPKKGVLLNYLRDGKKSWAVIEQAAK